MNRNCQLNRRGLLRFSPNPVQNVASAVLRFMTDFEIVRSSEIPSDFAPHRLEIHLGVFVKGCGDLLLRLAGPEVVGADDTGRSEEHTSELQSLRHLVCRLLLE